MARRTAQCDPTAHDPKEVSKMFLMQRFKTGGYALPVAERSLIAWSLRSFDPAEIVSSAQRKRVIAPESSE